MNAAETGGGLLSACLKLSKIGKNYVFAAPKIRRIFERFEFKSLRKTSFSLR
jgi:hypothetical protein